MILILGGGLAGLATAYHLARTMPGVPRLVLEQDDEPGGLARSRQVGGFTFDLTGHYLHLRDADTTALVRDLLGERLQPVERRAFIHSRGARLDFPFQANLHGLPPEVVARCLCDFVNALREPAPTDARTPFDTWARAVFGAGIAEEFMLPYNGKLFGVDPGELTSEWVAWSVPRPDLEQVVRGALGLRNSGMGYNPSFLYPLEGGIGVLPRALAARVGDDLRTNARVVAVDAAARTVTLADGETLRWNRLVSTLPLPALLRALRGLGRAPARIAAELRSAAVIELALGVQRPALAGGAHWIYFPEPDVPFYRVGFPSNVRASLAPAGCTSVSVEIAHPAGAPVPGADALIARVRPALEATGVLAPDDRIVAADVALLDPAYVIFDPRRTPCVEEAIALLASAGIRSIGRFGAWTYSYMERALIDGREAAASIAAELGPRAVKSP